jgi:peptidoglycan-associated lipoprotein
MQKPSSPVSSGNISPAIVGPDKGTKEVYVVGGLVLSLAIVIGAFWFYSQDLAVSSARSNDQLTDNQVATMLQHTNATSPASEPLTKAVVAGSAGTIGDIAHSDIYFEVGRKGLTDEAKSILTAQAEVLKQDPDWGLLVQGYTDQQGSASYNKKLGLMRAEKVKEHLIGLGVSEQAIKVVSLGKEGVLCIDNSDVCRHMNRRVHLEMRKIGQAHMILPIVATDPKTTEPIQSANDQNSNTEDHGSLTESLLPSLTDPSATDPASGS